MTKVFYRAIHTKSLWRRVNSHLTLENAIHGKDGAAGLFARKARINYETHGDPLYVVIWEDGAQKGVVVRPTPTNLTKTMEASIPVSTILQFEENGQADQKYLEQCFESPNLPS